MGLSEKNLSEMLTKTSRMRGKLSASSQGKHIQREGTGSTKDLRCERACHIRRLLEDLCD